MQMSTYQNPNYVSKYIVKYRFIGLLVCWEKIDNKNLRVALSVPNSLKKGDDLKMIVI